MTVFRKSLIGFLFSLSSLMLSASRAVAVETPDEAAEQPAPAPADSPPGLQLGALTLVGSSCFNWDETPVILQPYRLTLPFRNWIKRPEGRRDFFGHCQFSIPLQVSAGVRLRIQALSARAIVNLSPLTEFVGKAEIQVTGDKSITASFQEHSLSQGQVQSMEAYEEKELVGECGQSWILKGNSEVLIRKGKGLATAKIDEIAVDYDLEPCE